MTRPRHFLMGRGWMYASAAAGPIGGGLIKLGQGSTLAAAMVGLAPYAIFGLLLLVFLIGYLAALARYLCAGQEGQEAMERLMVTSANAIVSILTLTQASPAPWPSQSHLVPRHRLGPAEATGRDGTGQAADHVLASADTTEPSLPSNRSKHRGQ
jgi:hypothetical protein